MVHQWLQIRLLKQRVNYLVVKRPSLIIMHGLPDHFFRVGFDVVAVSQNEEPFPFLILILSKGLLSFASNQR